MKKPEIFGNSGLFIAQPGENGENSHCSVGNPNPRIRDQKAAGSNPATSTTKTGYPSWVPCFRVLVSGVRNPKALQRPWVSEPNVSTVCCPPQAEERRTNQSKRAMRPLQGSSAKIEIAGKRSAKIPSIRLAKTVGHIDVSRYNHEYIRG